MNTTMIQESIDFNVRMAKRLLPYGLDFLIWASPCGTRTPEDTTLWQPLFYKKKNIEKILTYLFILLSYSTLGFIRFFTYRGFFYHYINQKKPILLIIPDEITDHSKRIQTSYLIENEQYPLDKIVFSRRKNIGNRFYSAGMAKRLSLFVKLIFFSMADLFHMASKKRFTFEYLTVFILFLRWTVSHTWHFHLEFYYFIKEIVSANKDQYKALLCLHEMNFYSKLIWRVAKECQLKGITAQHAASIVPEKFWFFQDELEIKAGCSLPNIFLIYHNDVKNLLNTSYPETIFLPVCSPRYKKWRTTALNKTAPRDTVSLLFASAIMAYDVSIVIKAIQKLLNEKGDRNFNEKKIKLILRLHPDAYIHILDKLWLKFSAKESALFTFETSKKPLKDDLERATVVLGAGSTVLREALMLGLAVIKLCDEDFISYSIISDLPHKQISVHCLSLSDILNQLEIPRQTEMIRERVEKTFGLCHPVLSSQMIYGLL